MKMVLTIVFLTFTIVSFSYSMEKHVNNTEETASLKDELFEENIQQLRKPIADFIQDFKTWPQEEQNKITTYDNQFGMGYFISGRPAASDKYNGSIGYYLDCRLTQQQIAPFVILIDHVKKQNQTK